MVSRDIRILDPVHVSHWSPIMECFRSCFQFFDNGMRAEIVFFQFLGLGVLGIWLIENIIRFVAQIHAAETILAAVQIF